MCYLMLAKLIFLWMAKYQISPFLKGSMGSTDLAFPLIKDPMPFEMLLMWDTFQVDNGFGWLIKRLDGSQLKQAGLRRIPRTTGPYCGYIGPQAQLAEDPSWHWTCNKRSNGKTHNLLGPTSACLLVWNRWFLICKFLHVSSDMWGPHGSLSSFELIGELFDS